MKTLEKIHPELCEAGILERPRYFPRQLMTPEELILEQNYARDKMRRHNRMLHGWGVVCGAIVCRVPKIKVEDKAILSFRGKEAHPCPDDEDDNCLDPWHVSVSSGYILGPYGDEILLPCDVLVDVRQACTTGASGDPCPPPPDPWCAEVTADLQPGPVWLALRYKELMTRPVRVQPVGCGCDETACEFSRIRDGYEICTLDRCPDSHQGNPQDPWSCRIDACPPCPEDPWVVLDCRRHVMTFANYWCKPKKPGLPWKDEVEHEVLGEPAEKTSPDPEIRPEEEEQFEGDSYVDHYSHKAVKIPVEDTSSEQFREVALECLDLMPEDLVDENHFEDILKRNATNMRGIRPGSGLGKVFENRKITIFQLGKMRSRLFFDIVKDLPRIRQKRDRDRLTLLRKNAEKVIEAYKIWQDRQTY